MTAANVWLIVAIVSFVLSGLSLIASIVIFIKFKILNVVADLSGKTVARGIKEMQDETAASNSKKGRFSLDREDVTGKMSAKNIRAVNLECFNIFSSWILYYKHGF